MTDADKHEDHSSHRQMNADPTNYTCPMHPEIRSSSPGTCPKCGMKLVPVAMSEGGMHHREHAMKQGSKMSRWERFKMSMTMEMGMEHTGVAGREMARLMELDIRNKFFFALILSVPNASSLASLPAYNSGILLLRLDLPLLKHQGTSTENTEHVSSHRSRHNCRLRLQRSPNDSAER